jgi:hypothetical protein
MASARKPYARTKPEHAGLPASEVFERACFIDDLLNGRVRATAVHELRDGRGRLVRLDYDDPNGAGAAPRDTPTKEPNGNRP